MGDGADSSEGFAEVVVVGWAGSSVSVGGAWAFDVVAVDLAGVSSSLVVTADSADACTSLAVVAVDPAGSSSEGVAVDPAACFAEGETVGVDGVLEAFDFLTNLPCWFLGSLDFLLMQSVT
jgi:hypothetical protein